MQNTVETHPKKRELVTNATETVTVNMWNDSISADPYIYYSSNVTKVLNEKRTIGFNIHNYHARKRRGELLPMTPFRQLERTGSTAGWKNQTNTSGTHIWAQSPEGYLLKNGWIITEDEILAQAPTLDETWALEAAAEIYNSGFDALTNLAEFKDSVRLFTNIGKGILKLHLPRFLLVGRVRKYTLALNSAYLATRYGLRPILADIMSLNQALKLWKEKRTRYTGSSGYRSSQSVPSFTVVPTSWYDEETTISTDIVVSQRGSVIADIDVPLLQVNPLQTGWELIPYSFVVDWFLDVGKTLAAIAFLGRVQRYAACTGYRIEMNRTFDSRNGDPGPIYVSGGYEQTGVCSATLEVRKPCQVPLQFPQLVLRMNNWKIADLVSLVAQRML